MSLYLPEHFATGERTAIARLMHEHPFATLLTPAAPEPRITHLPLVHVADREPHGTLLGHFARANPHVDAAAVAESIAIFHGPHAYVSPSWYARPAAAVPTWNYAVVHAHGAIELARYAGRNTRHPRRDDPTRRGCAPDAVAPRAVSFGARRDGGRDHRVSDPRPACRREIQAVAESRAGGPLARRDGARRRRLRGSGGDGGVDARVRNASG
jgi:hypothetical protein